MSRWLGRALTPPAITAVREAMVFGHAHSLSSRRIDWVAGYRRAFRYGIHYLPAGQTLDGLVVDVGANRGDFTATIRQLEPRSRVLAVEPAPTVAQDLVSRFATDAAVTIDQHALSDRNGTARLNETERSEFSSLLTPVGGIAVANQVEVTTITLDELVEEPVKLLKLDVQGHEVSVLHGAEQMLSKTEAVLTEVTFEPLYEGATTFGELDAFLREADFVLAGLTEPGRIFDRAQWSDACYIRG